MKCRFAVCFGLMSLLITSACISCSGNSHNLTDAIESVDVEDRHSVKIAASAIRESGTVGKKMMLERLRIAPIAERVKIYMVCHELKVIQNMPIAYQAEYYSIRVSDKGYLSGNLPSWYTGPIISITIYDNRRKLRTAVFDLIELGEVAIPFLVALLENPDENVVCTAEYGLKELLPNVGIQTLLPDGKTDDGLARKWDRFLQDNRQYLKWNKDHTSLYVDANAKANSTPIDANTGEILSGVKLTAAEKEPKLIARILSSSWLWEIYGNRMR